jgi:hypothetical protein
MSETELSRSIQSALEGLGALVTRIQSGSLRGAGGHVQCARKGTPDLGVIAELAAALRADPDSLFAEAEDYVQHQVISEQKPGNRWMTRLRSQLRRKAKAGLLPAPGAIEHAKKTGIPVGWTPHPSLPGKWLDERGATRNSLPRAS